MASCLAVASAERLPLARNSVDLIFTDPPYLKEYRHTYAWLACEAMRVLKPGGFVLAYSGGYYLDQNMVAFAEAGLSFFWLFSEHNTGGAQGAVFVRNRRVLAMEKPILCYYKPGPKVPLPRVGGVQSVFLATGKQKAYHHWGQSVGAARYYIDHFSAEGNTVLDPFVGGGTTAVACELIGRQWIAFDIDPAAIETARCRLIDPATAPVNQMRLL